MFLLFSLREKSNKKIKAKILRLKMIPSAYTFPNSLAEHEKA